MYLQEDTYTRQGRVEAVSVQGNNYFAVIRYSGVQLPDMMGNPVDCGRTLAGIPEFISEDVATMTDLLIPINISAIIQVTDPKLIVGSVCVVYHEKDTAFPIYAVLASDHDARSLKRKLLFNARMSQQDGLIDDISKKQLEDVGVKDSELADLLNERYDPHYHKGYVGSYGSHQNMFTTQESHMHDKKDFLPKVRENYVTSLMGKELRKKECYKPATIITGNS